MDTSSDAVHDSSILATQSQVYSDTVYCVIDPVVRRLPHTFTIMAAIPRQYPDSPLEQDNCEFVTSTSCTWEITYILPSFVATTMIEQHDASIQARPIDIYNAIHAPMEAPEKLLFKTSHGLHIELWYLHRLTQAQQIKKCREIEMMFFLHKNSELEEMFNFVNAYVVEHRSPTFNSAAKHLYIVTESDGNCMSSIIGTLTIPHIQYIYWQILRIFKFLVSAEIFTELSETHFSVSSTSQIKLVCITDQLTDIDTYLQSEKPFPKFPFTSVSTSANEETLKVKQQKAVWNVINMLYQCVTNKWSTLEGLTVGEHGFVPDQIMAIKLSHPNITPELHAMFYKYFTDYDTCTIDTLMDLPFFDSARHVYPIVTCSEVFVPMVQGSLPIEQMLYTVIAQGPISRRDRMMCLPPVIV